jgi:hypothetical protein
LTWVGAADAAELAHTLDRMAVLAPSNTAAARWRDVLADGEIPVIPLEEYAGAPHDRVKVGTLGTGAGISVTVLEHERFPGRTRQSHTLGRAAGAHVHADCLRD